MPNTIDPVEQAIERALQRERRLGKVAKAKAALIAKAEAQAQEEALPKLSGSPEQIGWMRAKALRVPEQDVTPNRLQDLYNDAVARGMVEGVEKPVVSRQEIEAYHEERVQRGQQAKAIRNAAKWMRMPTFWKTASIAEGGDHEDYEDMFPEE